MVYCPREGTGCPATPPSRPTPAQQPALRIPEHIGVIMDGNGRWAQRARQAAHRGPRRGRQGAAPHGRALHPLRRRPPHGLQLLVRELAPAARGSELHLRAAPPLRRLRPRAAGRATTSRSASSATARGSTHPLQRLIDDVERKTAGNTGLAARRRLQLRRQGRDHRGDAADRRARSPRACSSPRTSPSRRSRRRSTPPAFRIPISSSAPAASSGSRNFLLWQAAYSELVFVEENWPDFDEDTFLRVLEEYRRAGAALRRRRGARTVTDRRRTAGRAGPVPARVVRSRFRDSFPPSSSSRCSSPASVFGGYVFAALVGAVFAGAYREWEQVVTLKPLSLFGGMR